MASVSSVGAGHAGRPCWNRGRDLAYPRSQTVNSALKGLAAARSDAVSAVRCGLSRLQSCHQRHHSTTMEHPIYMRGCKGLYQERDQTPDFLEGRAQTREGCHTHAHLYSKGSKFQIMCSSLQEGQRLHSSPSLCPMELAPPSADGLHEYLTENAPPQDPTVGLSLGS